MLGSLVNSAVDEPLCWLLNRPCCKTSHVVDNGPNICKSSGSHAAQPNSCSFCNFTVIPFKKIKTLYTYCRNHRMRAFWCFWWQPQRACWRRASALEPRSPPSLFLSSVRVCTSRWTRPVCSREASLCVPWIMISRPPGQLSSIGWMLWKTLSFFLSSVTAVFRGLFI